MASISDFLSNSRLIRPIPVEEVELILLTPRIVFSNPSSGAVTSCSTSLGDAFCQYHETERLAEVRVETRWTGNFGTNAAPMIIRIRVMIRIEKEEVRFSCDINLCRVNYWLGPGGKTFKDKLNYPDNIDAP